MFHNIITSSLHVFFRVLLSCSNNSICIAFPGQMPATLPCSRIGPQCDLEAFNNPDRRRLNGSLCFFWPFLIDVPLRFSVLTVHASTNLGICLPSLASLQWLEKSSCAENLWRVRASVRTSARCPARENMRDVLREL